MDSQEIEVSKLGLTRLCRTRADGPLPGDRCPEKGCGGSIVVYNSQGRGGWRIRYLRCNACKKCPVNNKMISADDVDERK